MKVAPRLNAGIRKFIFLAKVKVIPMTTEEQDLKQAVETLYELFSSYPLALQIEGCPCCISAEDEAQLHSKPLRELKATDLSRYAFKAMTTWGSEDDFKHFLPRLLELVTDADSITREVDVEIIFGKLHYAKWQMWPTQEREAVQQYLMALWIFLLAFPQEAVPIDEYLCGIGQAEDDLTHYLDAWQNTKTDTALNELIAFVVSQDSLHKRKLTDSFWSGRRVQMSQVVDWLFSIGLAE